MAIYTEDDLQRVYDEITGSAVCNCRLTREGAGGIPADDPGLNNFFIHQMGIDPDDTAKLESLRAEYKGTNVGADREKIIDKENGKIGTKDVTPEEGEIQEQQTYGVNMWRKDKIGCYFGDWMVKANLKNAFTCCRLFQAKRGVKKDVVEAGRISAVEHSLLDKRHPDRIYVTDDEGEPVKTFYQKVSGRVDTPRGPKSIQVDVECVPEGSIFAFKFQWYNELLEEEDVKSVFAVARNIGLGSGRSLHMGKFAIDRLEVTIPAKARREKPSKGKKVLVEAA